MADAAQWEADPEREDQQGSWDGDARADEVGPGGLDDPGADFDRPPDHVPHLHRAMSEAAADLEAVDNRLSTLFDRTKGPGGPTPRPESAQRSTLHAAFAPGGGGTTAADEDDVVDVDDDIFDFFEDGEVVEVDDDALFAQPTSVTTTDRMAIIGEYEDDIAGDFAALDAELAAEEPDGPVEPKRRMFRRRATGKSAARR